MSQESDDKKTEDTENVLNLDRILAEEVGQFGKYQIRVLALYAVLGTLYSLQTNNYIFIFSKVRTRCMIPECESSNPQLNFTPSWIHDAVPSVDGSMDGCHRFGNKSSDTMASCSSELFDQSTVVGCEEYVYEDKNTAYYEFKMACDDWRPTLVGSVPIAGIMLSQLVVGVIADRWGRRITLALAVSIGALISCFKFFANSYNVYIVLSFLETATGGATFPCIFILAVECMGAKYRVIAGALMTTSGALGLTLEGLIAWTGPYWRHLILILSGPALVGILFLWISPESVRWLMSKGRYEEAKATLEYAAKVNGNLLSEKTLKAFSEGIKQEKKSQVTPKPWLVCLLFSHKRVLLHSILTQYWWITVLFVFYGLTIFSVGISGNRFLNYSAVASIEIPAHWIAFFLLNRMGRKSLLISGYWICGACQIAYIFISDGPYWQSLLVYVIGKLSITVVVTANYVFTTELFPTEYRTSLVTFSTMMGRLGAICAPLTPAMSSAIWVHLPFALFAAMAMLAGLLVLLAPETLGVELPDTMQEANNIGRRSSQGILHPLRRFVFRTKTYTVR